MDRLITVDAKGNVVLVGSLVEIVDIEMSQFRFLEPNEIEDIRSMIGERLPVEHIAVTGVVRVTKWFDRGPGRHESHTLSLLPQHIALVG